MYTLKCGTVTISCKSYKLKIRPGHCVVADTSFHGIEFQNYAEGEQGEVERLLDEVSSSLDRIRSRVVGEIQSQLDGMMSKGEGLVRRLEAELNQLSDKRATLEVQAISQDHIGFLQVRPEPTNQQVIYYLSAVPAVCQHDIITCHLRRATRRPRLLWWRISRLRWTRTSPSTSSWLT